MTLYSVPIIVETTYIYEVEARNGYDAAAKAALRHASEDDNAEHEHQTKSTMGKILPTVTKPGRVAGEDALTDG